MGLSKFLEIILAGIASVGGIGVIILGFSSWFGKIWANKLYENERRKQEEYLTEVQNKFDSKLAELNSQLEKSRVQFEILNKERIDVIKCLYMKLVDMQDFMSIYFRELKSENIKGTEYSVLIKSVSEFMDYNNHNRILFSEKICHSISEIDALITIILNLNYYSLKELNDKDDEARKITLDIIDKLIKEEIPKFKSELEYEFRNIIGVVC